LGAKPLNQSQIARRNGEGPAKKGNQNLKVEPTMLMKTKEGDKRCEADPTMFMKTSNL
jgi:hypothetical protein